MKTWILSSASYFLSDWYNLVIGGLVVVGVIIFLMGMLKSLLINKVKNSLMRKIILSWGSLILTLPATVLSILCNGFAFEHFWCIYAINCVGVILIYWVYENTALRNSLALIGKKVVTKIFLNLEETKEAVKSANKDVESLLNNSSKSLSKYKDDDLKNL
jgi:hypothetical protein